jgi:hypothetical protein
MQQCIQEPAKILIKLSLFQNRSDFAGSCSGGIEPSGVGSGSGWRMERGGGVFTAEKVFRCWF